MIEVQWQNLRAPALRSLAEDYATVIVPVGSIEQHGPHLPVQVDALLATEVSVRAAQRVAQSQSAQSQSAQSQSAQSQSAQSQSAQSQSAQSQSVVVAPTVWSGLAEHHMAFGATITLDFDTFRAVLRGVCESIARHGFPRILLLNGHGGNVSAFGVIAGELERALGARIAAATYWHLTEVVEVFPTILERQRNVRHAGEAETSMLLALRPELVDTEAMMSNEGGLANIVDESGAYRFRSLTELTETGVIGFPAAASADKGEKLLDAAGRAVANVILEGSIWR